MVVRTWGGRRWILAAVSLAAAVLSVMALRQFGVLTWIDVHLLRERVKDIVAVGWGGEDWQRGGPTLHGDTAWLNALHDDPRIAHALGASGTADANTDAALTQALRDGFRVVEVDVWLDADGRLRCHHGPDPAAPYRDGDCLVDGLVARAAAAGAWVVLDIKTDWDKALATLLARLPERELARSIIVQIYVPDQLDRVAALQVLYPLPAPIVTAYLSHRSLDHVAAGASSRGVRAFAVPVERLPALGGHPQGIEVFAHPVHDCQAMAAVRRAGWRGAFTLTGLRCPSGASSL